MAGCGETRMVCGTCGHFRTFAEFFPYVEEDSVEKATNALFGEFDRKRIGVCDVDDPMPVSEESDITTREDWDCWEPRPRKWREDRC